MTDDRYQQGLEMRTKVLGSEYVKAATGDADDIFRRLQDLVTESCWGTVWRRREVPPQTRSMAAELSGDLRGIAATAGVIRA